MRAKVETLHRALVWEKFGSKTTAVDNVVLDTFMERKDVQDFVKSVTKGITLNGSNSSSSFYFFVFAVFFVFFCFYFCVSDNCK